MARRDRRDPSLSFVAYDFLVSTIVAALEYSSLLSPGVGRPGKEHYDAFVSGRTSFKQAMAFNALG